MARPPVPTTNPLGARIRSAREARGLSLVELAARLGVNPRTVRAAEMEGRGKAVPLACDMLGVSCNVDDDCDDDCDAADPRACQEPRVPSGPPAACSSFATESETRRVMESAASADQRERGPDAFAPMPTATTTATTATTAPSAGATPARLRVGRRANGSLRGVTLNIRRIGQEVRVSGLQPPSMREMLADLSTQALRACVVVALRQDGSRFWEIQMGAARSQAELDALVAGLRYAEHDLLSECAQTVHDTGGRG
jgi:DNA-binding XRE family transcriptional regulator